VILPHTHNQPIGSLSLSPKSHKARTADHEQLGFALGGRGVGQRLVQLEVGLAVQVGGLDVTCAGSLAGGQKKNVGWDVVIALDANNVTDLQHVCEAKNHNKIANNR
jgi:hypothetical protein